MKKITLPTGSLTLAAHLHVPEDFSEDRSYPAIVVVHPGGGVKEQTAGLYASRLAERGFVALAYDASYQGESGGELRHLEDPYARVEDVRAVVDYLSTRSFIQPDKIAALGICAGGGYALGATMTDSRIKAVGTVSAVNIGPMIRNGWYGTDDPAQSIGLRDAASAMRTAEASGAAITYMPLAPSEPSPDLPPDLADAYEYYHTDRAQHPNSPGKAPLQSLNRLLAFDAFHLADVLLTQPLLAIAGDQAGSLWHSERVVEVAASDRKKLHIVEGANHMDLYDGPSFVDEALGELVPFFHEYL